MGQGPTQARGCPEEGDDHDWTVTGLLSLRGRYLAKKWVQ